MPYANMRPLHSPADSADLVVLDYMFGHSEIDAAPSPDGQFFAYVRHAKRDGKTCTRLDVRVTWSDQVVFQSEYDPRYSLRCRVAWAPQPLDSGDWLLFVVSRHQLPRSYAVSPAGCVQRLEQSVAVFGLFCSVLIEGWTLRVCNEFVPDTVHTIDSKTGKLSVQHRTEQGHPCTDHINYWRAGSTFFRRVNSGQLLIWSHTGVFLRHVLVSGGVRRGWTERTHKYFPNVRFRQQIMQLLLVYRRLADEGRAPVPYEVWLYMLRFVPILALGYFPPVYDAPGMVDGGLCTLCRHPPLPQLS